MCALAAVSPFDFVRSSEIVASRDGQTTVAVMRSGGLYYGVIIHSDWTGAVRAIEPALSLDDALVRLELLCN